MADENKCPECYNDIYKPFSYCSSCGWEKKDDDEAKPPVKDKKDKKKSAKPKDKKGKGKSVPCPKCGKKVEVDTDERPVTIKCKNCGAKGTLKAKPDEGETESGREEDSDKKKGKKKKMKEDEEPEEPTEKPDAEEAEDDEEEKPK